MGKSYDIQIYDAIWQIKGKIRFLAKVNIFHILIWSAGTSDELCYDFPEIIS